MYSLYMYIGSLCNAAFPMARFTCIVTSQVFVKIWMRWRITLSSVFYRGTKHLWIVFSFKPHSPRVAGKQCKNQLEVTSTPFYQVQGQMEVCDVDFCDFVCWTPSGIHVERNIFLRYCTLVLYKIFLRNCRSYMAEILPIQYKTLFIQ